MGYKIISVDRCRWCGKIVYDYEMDSTYRRDSERYGTHDCNSDRVRIGTCDYVGFKAIKRGDD